MTANDCTLVDCGAHVECSCGEWARMKTDDVEADWAEHTGEEYLREGDPAFNGAFA